MKIQHFALYIVLLVFGSCQMEIPALKTLKPCSSTPTIQTTQDVSNPSIFKFTLQNTAEIDGTVTWALKYTNATTNLSSQTGSPSVIPSFTVPVLNNSAYTLMLTYQTICGDIKTTSTAFSAQTPQLSTASSFSFTDPMVHSNLRAVAVANDGTVIANDKNLIKVWNYNTKTLLRTLTGHTANITDLVLSTDEKYLFSSSYSNTIIVYDWKTGTEIRKLTGHTSYVYALAVSADNKYLASSSYDNTLKIWNVADGTLLRSITNTYPMNKVSISNDAQYVAAQYSNNTNNQYGFKVWNGQTGTELWDSPNSNTQSVALSPDGSQLWVTKSGTIEKWNTSSKALTKTYTNSSNDLSMSIDGKYLYTGSMTIDIVADKTLYTGKVSNHYSYSPEYNAISASNQYVCSGNSYTGSLALCPLSTGDKINNSPSKHPSLIKYAYLSKDKKSLISNDVSSARVWDLATGTEKTSSTSTLVGSAGFSNVGVMTDAIWLKSCGFEKHNLSNGAVSKAYIYANYCSDKIAISPDDKFLVIQNSSNTVGIYDANDGTLLKTLSLSGTNPSINYIEFTPDNKYLITGSYDKTIRIWDVATGALIKTITATTNQIDGGVLSADGMMVAVADYNKVEVYTVATGALLTSITHNGSNAYGLAFSPDSKRLAIGGNYTGKLNIFDVATGILQKEKVLDYAIRNVYYNAAGTQLYVVTERDFQVLNL